MQVCLSLSQTSTQNLSLRYRFGHDMNSPAFTLCYNHVWLTIDNGLTIMLWSGSTESWSRIGFLKHFLALHWSICLAYLHIKTWLTWKFLFQLLEFGRAIDPILPTWLCACNDSIWAYQNFSERCVRILRGRLLVGLCCVVVSGADVLPYFPLWSA